jgi:hypothetical protein
MSESEPNNDTNRSTEKPAAPKRGAFPTSRSELADATPYLPQSSEDDAPEGTRRTSPEPGDGSTK